MKYLYPVFFFLLIIRAPLFSQVTDINPADWPSIKGLWEYDDPTDITRATFGTDLVLTGSHTSIPGPSAGDLAVNIGIGSYYKCYHNIPANGGGNEVNEYSLVIDFRVPVISPWYCFYQTNAGNGNDGELFVSPTGSIGRATNGPGYTEYQLIPGEWYRLAVTADLGSHYKIYLDGVLVRDGGSLPIDADFALYPLSGNSYFYFFADNDGEDAPVDIALCSVFEGTLSPQEVEFLGGYGHDITPVLTGILPYLQTPTPTSMYISWHSDILISTEVQVGTTPSLGNSLAGSYENINGKHWHTVKLENLSPGTEYFYKCLSGSEESDVFSFRTPSLPGTSGNHLRFLIFGDNQTNAAQSRFIAQQAKSKMIQWYGNDIHKQISLVMNHGDIVGNGASVGLFEDEYFKPFSCLSATIPCMVSIGNHEVESSYYYQYMKYEDLPGPAAPITERYYSFQIGSVKFIALNTNPLYQNMNQENWLFNQLNEAQSDASVDFVFVFGHHPSHSEIWPDGNTPWVQNTVLNLMKNFSKSAFYGCGHTHAYEHGVIESVSDSGDFRYQINGGAGGALDRWGMYANQTDYPEIHKAFDHYGFTLIDIDVDEKAYDGYTFSLGHPDLPLDCSLTDTFHRRINQLRPDKPATLSPVGDVLVPDTTILAPVVLCAAAFSGFDTLMTSHFQLTADPGNYTDPIFDSKNNKDNYYGDSGTPGFEPINLNEGLTIENVIVMNSLLANHTYGWRVRFRDDNLRWSEWSDEALFTLAGGFTISGTVEYDNYLHTTMEQVEVSLYRNDTVISSTNTDNQGHYSFPSIQPGHYRISCSYTGDWGGVNATDALIMLRHFVGLSYLQGIRKKAGDVDGSHIINAVDPLASSKRFTGMINSFPAGDWVFESPEFEVFSGGIILTIKGLCMGDVNGSFEP